MTKRPLLAQAQKDAVAIARKLESILNQVKNLPSFKGKAALMDKVIAAWNMTQYLNCNLGVELRDEELLKNPRLP